MGVTADPRPGDTAPASLGLRPPPLRAWCRGSEDMDIEEMEGEAEARRLGSLHTEVGGATRAMSGIRETGAGGSRRGRGPRVRTEETAGSRMLVTSSIVTTLR